MISAFTLVEQIAEQIEFGRNLGATDNRGQGTLRVLKRLGQGFKLGLHGSSGVSRQLVTEALGGRVRTVCGRKSVVHPDVAQLRQRSDKFGIVFLFTRVKTCVFQAEDVTGLHCGDRLFRNFADAVIRELHGPLDDARHLGGNRFQGLLRVASLGSAEVRKENDLAALVGDFGDRRCHALDAR